MGSSEKYESQYPEVAYPIDGTSSVGSPPPDYKPKPTQVGANVNYSAQSQMQPRPQQGPSLGSYAPPPVIYQQQQQQQFQGSPEQIAKARARTAKSEGFCAGILGSLACCCCLDCCCCC